MIVHPVAFVTGVASNCTGVPAVVTVADPSPPENATEARKINRQISQRGMPWKWRVERVMTMIIKHLTFHVKQFYIRLVWFLVLW